MRGQMILVNPRKLERGFRRFGARIPSGFYYNSGLLRLKVTRIEDYHETTRVTIMATIP